MNQQSQKHVVRRIFGIKLRIIDFPLIDVSEICQKEEEKLGPKWSNMATLHQFWPYLALFFVLLFAISQKLFELQAWDNKILQENQKCIFCDIAAKMTQNFAENTPTDMLEIFWQNLSHIILYIVCVGLKLL